jgi:hypothetical protein
VFGGQREKEELWIEKRVNKQLKQMDISCHLAVFVFSHQFAVVTSLAAGKSIEWRRHEDCVHQLYFTYR